MIWDVPHHRGAGFPLTILRPTGVYSVLSNLADTPDLAPIDLLSLLAKANVRDEPLVGRRDLSAGISDLLASLREQGLVVRSIGDVRGAHTRYGLTPLGAELIAALGPVTAWAMADFDFVVAATRIRLGLPPLRWPVPAALRTERAATGMAVGLLLLQWSNTLMVYVDSAGPAGISPQDLEEAVNTDIAASSGPNRVGRHLHRDTLNRTLYRLTVKGLLDRRAEPPRVRYRLTPHGRGFMDAWWQVAEDWGIKRDAELFQIMRMTTTWFEDGPDA